ncbi:hypothetical protein DPMN_145868 [Dreissena polymorpha]|uniref:Uncharacterized protein n=1 Tax=Dreissena polymorpha TaxID=45954 RepID=A0A9D4F7J8_DREPO|nr:hypothetical protein DPMN_145868 [Dreissena polymorpha]
MYPTETPHVRNGDHQPDPHAPCVGIRVAEVRVACTNHGINRRAGYLLDIPILNPRRFR